MLRLSAIDARYSVRWGSEALRLPLWRMGGLRSTDGKPEEEGVGGDHSDASVFIAIGCIVELCHHVLSRDRIALFEVTPMDAALNREARARGRWFAGARGDQQRIQNGRKPRFRLDDEAEAAGLVMFFRVQDGDDVHQRIPVRRGVPGSKRSQAGDCTRMSVVGLRLQIADMRWHL